MLGALAPSVAASPDGPWGELADTLVKSGITIAVMLVLGRLFLPHVFSPAARTKSPEVLLAASLLEIGRASCRERVCQYVEIPVVAVSLKKKTYKLLMIVLYK